MKEEYDADFDSPEARANFATRHIFNPAVRKAKRDELLKRFANEPVVNMFPRRADPLDLERIKTESSWLKAETSSSTELLEVCQCGTEKLISKSSDPERMRAVLLSLVFFDQFVFTHYPSIHEKYKVAFPCPKLRQHSFGGHASPSWLIYSRHGYDKETNWALMSSMFVGCVQHLRRWLKSELQKPVPELRSKVLNEISSEFEQQHVEKFQVPIGA